MVSDQDIVIVSPCHLEWRLLVPSLSFWFKHMSSLLCGLGPSGPSPAPLSFFFHQCGFICPVCSLAGPEQAHGFPAWKLHPETLSDTSILESCTLDGHY